MTVKVKLSIPEKELLSPGHQACQGCASTMAMRLALKGLGTEMVAVMPACCWTVISGAAPRTSLGVPLLHAPFASAAATAAGVVNALRAKGDDKTVVMAWAGDGGTFDIGLQSVSGCADRNEDMIYVCYDNEAYMNTGIQRSGATPAGGWTMTTPSGSRRPKKDLDAIIQAHNIPYFATGTPAYPEDLVRKFAKARAIKGFRFIHLMTPCPPGWKHDPDMSADLSKAAVLTGVFPLYEVDDGKFRLNMAPKTLRPIEEFIGPQGRFSRLSAEDKAAMQQNVERRWQALLARHQAGR